MPAPRWHARLKLSIKKYQCAISFLGLSLRTNLNKSFLLDFHRIDPGAIQQIPEGSGSGEDHPMEAGS